jgi:hypothetical protein
MTRNQERITVVRHHQDLSDWSLTLWVWRARRGLLAASLLECVDSLLSVVDRGGNLVNGRGPLRLGWGGAALSS